MNAQEQGGAPAIGGLVDAVAAAIRKHSMYLVGGSCIAAPACDWEGHAGEYPAHQAAVVVEALDKVVDVDRAAACIWGEITDEFWSRATPEQQERYRGIARAALGVSVVRGTTQ